ncbi:hypothetical protein UPYG_G00134780 [Umbra pygmaea]|uniref:Disks large-associated protein 5 n=1 Tax=Umbra pygmaea TaxID=75934 RepID=A0ABD0WTX1_UMBPY
MDSMEARFGYMRERDTSVDMLRVKLSRRRSRSQKENRDKALNIRRQLEKVAELECSQQDISIAGNMSIQEKTSNSKDAKNAAVEERKMRLATYKERKALVKEKDKREREKKGVFKVGLYRAQPLTSLVQPPAPPRKARATATAAQPQSARVTRSTVRQQAPKTAQPISTAPLSMKVETAVARSTRKTRVTIVEPIVSVPSTRTGNRPQASVAPVARIKPSVTKSNTKQMAAPPAGHGRNTRGSVEISKQAAVKVEKAINKLQVASPPPAFAKEDEQMEDLPPAEQAPPMPLLPPAPIPSSFAPKDFVFQAPAGLSSFKPTPLSPRSTDSFFKTSLALAPSPNWPTDDLGANMNLSAPSPVKSVVHSPPRSFPSVTPSSPQEQSHDLPYFRSVVVSETEKLTCFCRLWELRVEDTSIPEEMRDRMRTAVGQARLLMKERFGQFSSLMDDCELGRGEKITTCSDLQGFWDMVYFQVEDVNKKFGALVEAESRGWQEECQPPPRQRRVVKKLPSAPVPKPAAGGAAAKSRLAAIKAAVKAKQQAADAERAARAAGSGDAVEHPVHGNQAPEPPVVFNGGFFQVESPAKLPGCAIRSSRSSAVSPGFSPCPGSKFTTPRRTRLSNAVAASPLTRLNPVSTTPRPDRALLHAPHSGPPSGTLVKRTPAGVPCCVSPVKHTLVETQLEECPGNQSEKVTRLSDQPEHRHKQETCDQSEVVEESTVCTEGHTESCDSEEPNQSSSNTQGLTNNEQHREALSMSVASKKPSLSERVSMCEVSSPVAAPPVTCSPLQDREEPSGTSLFSERPLSVIPGTESSPVMNHAFRFTLSPTPAHPSLAMASPPLPVCSLSDVQVSLSFSADTDLPVTMTPDTSVTEGLPGLDFERYIQPNAGCSWSPQEQCVTEEMQLPVVVDVEMESPVAASVEPTHIDILTPTAVSNMAHMFTPWNTKSPESDLLLFTSDPLDRVRQSTCPSDLMSFTPPTHR